MEQAKLSAQLLHHYAVQWKDRQIYWMCRSRSRTEKDLLTCIIDSYDRGKVMLPRFPPGRTPKSSVYDSLKRTVHAFALDHLFAWGLECMPLIWSAKVHR